jgi:hypothetical protein
MKAKFSGKELNTLTCQWIATDTAEDDAAIF